jgi:hypothetical protein
VLAAVDHIKAVGAGDDNSYGNAWVISQSLEQQLARPR